MGGEERGYNFFLQEREKVNYFWLVEKRSFAEKQAELRNQERQLQDQEERHQIELKMFQQRLKHLRYHEQDEIVELKTQGEYKLKLQEDRDRVAESAMREDRNGLKREMRMEERGVEEYIRNLKLEQDAKINTLRAEFDVKARDLQTQAAQKMKLVREEMEREGREEVQALDEQTNSHIQKCMSRNAKDFHDIKLYYGDLTGSNLELIKRLKGEHSELKQRESSDAKQMFDLQSKNRQLAVPLKKAQLDVERLQEQSQLYDLDKKRLSLIKSKILEKEEALKERQFQSEVLLQECEKVEKERDDIYEKFQSCVYGVQEKTGLKNLLLNKKFSALSEQVEVAGAQISELLIVANTNTNTNTDTTGIINSKVEDLVKQKNEQINELHAELQRIKGAYAYTTHAYESKLALYGIPIDELGFVPATSTN